MKHTKHHDLKAMKNSLLNLNLSTSESIEFYRVENIIRLQQNGTRAQVLFKKEEKRPKETKYEFSKEDKTLPVTDGGLCNKTLKYWGMNTTIGSKKLNKTVQSQRDTKFTQLMGYSNYQANTESCLPTKDKKSLYSFSINNTEQKEGSAPKYKQKLTKLNYSNTQPNFYIKNKLNTTSDQKICTEATIASPNRNDNQNASIVNVFKQKENLIEKRKKYSVPSVKSKKDSTKMFTAEDRNMNSNLKHLKSMSHLETFKFDKMERVKILNQNNKIICIQNYQKYEQNQANRKAFKDIQKKMDILKANNIPVDGLDDGVEITDNEISFNKEIKEENESEMNEIKDRSNSNYVVNSILNTQSKSSQINNKSESKGINQCQLNKTQGEQRSIMLRKNNRSLSTANFNLITSQSEVNHNHKLKRKPKIDSFGFLSRIYKEIDLKQNDQIQETPEEDGRSCSFRQSANWGKIGNQKDQKIKKPTLKCEVSIENPNDVLLVRKTVRSKQEIRDFMLKSRQQSNDKAIKIMEEENLKSLNQYMRLRQLKEIIKKNSRLRGRKIVKNEYYIGSNHNLTKLMESKSTVIDPNEFIYNVLESKNIILNNLNRMNKKSGSMPDFLGKQYVHSQPQLNYARDELKLDFNSQDGHKENSSNKSNWRIYIRREGDSSNSVYSSPRIKLNESLVSKVNRTLNKFDELLHSDHLNQILKSSYSRSSHSVSIHTIDDNEDIAEQARNEMLHIKEDKEYKEEISRNSNQNSRALHQSDNEPSNECSVIEPKYSNEQLIELNKKFNHLSLWFKMLNRWRCLNNIVNYGNDRYRCKIGFECLNILIKSIPFNIIINYINDNLKHELARIEAMVERLSQIIKFKIFERIIYYIHCKEEYEEEPKSVLVSENSIDQSSEHNKNEQSSQSIEHEGKSDKMKETNFDKRMSKQIEFGILMLKLPFIVDSMNKIAAFAYNDHNIETETEEIQLREIAPTKADNSPSSDNVDIKERKSNRYSLNTQDPQNSSNLGKLFDVKSYVLSSSSITQKTTRLKRLYKLVNEGNGYLNKSDSIINKKSAKHLNLSINSSYQSNKSNRKELSSGNKGKEVKSISEILRTTPYISAKNTISKQLSSDEILCTHQSQKEGKGINAAQISISDPQVDATSIQEKGKEMMMKKQSKLKENQQQNCGYNEKIDRHPSNCADCDISADKDNLNQIDWEYSVMTNKCLGSEGKEHKDEGNKASLIQKEDINLPIKVIEPFGSKVDKDKKEEEKDEDDVKNDLQNNSINENEFPNMKIDDECIESNDNFVNILDKEANQIIYNVIEDQDDNEYKEEHKVIEPPIPESISKYPINIIKQRNIMNTIDSDQCESAIEDKQKSKSITCQDLTSNSLDAIMNLNTSAKIFITSELSAQQYKIDNQIKPNDESHHIDTPLKKIIDTNSLDIRDLVDYLSKGIVKTLLNDEINTSEKSLIPKKANKYVRSSMEHLDTSQLQINNSASFGGSSSSQNASMQLNTNKNLKINAHCEDVFNSASSPQCIVNNSIFMKTITEIKNESSFNLYYDEIAPKLIDLIIKEIGGNYPAIYERIKVPFMFDINQLLNDLISDENRRICFSNTNSHSPGDLFLDKTIILSSFNKVNEKIRAENNSIDSMDYDNMLNECIIDASNEIIENERPYGKMGHPLPWSNRTRELRYRYENDKSSAENFQIAVKDKLETLMNCKMGLIFENYPNMDIEQLSQDRNRKFMMEFANDLNSYQNEWRNFEIQETRVKLEIENEIMEELLNETIEILEHVQLSRVNPLKYNNKSIFACEDIPKLSFQYSSENDIDDIMNQ